MQAKPADSDVPFFPFKLAPSGDAGYYQTSSHLLASPVRLNRDAAEVLRLADGQTPLADIVSRLADRYPEARGDGQIRSRLVETLHRLTQMSLVWWRKAPMAPAPIGAPSSVFWEVTAACNLRCLHCVVSAGAKLDGELAS